MNRPAKHSLTLAGHRTSVSLEEDFWRAFREIARERGQPINALAAEIDRERGLETGLASAIRLFVLRELQAKLPAASPRRAQPPDQC
ncbi:MAG: ribbon-helix-helix domain-containing protein [Tropicimonas sp.]|uniref:ribbon-helix-helix domain-containing protein n=1 Tax=Tropicimonas sp. TaxID=2067044 RepID=UPI003A8A69AE